MIHFVERKAKLLAAIAVAVVVSSDLGADAQEGRGGSPKPAAISATLDDAEAPAAEANAVSPERLEKFAKYMSGAKLVGRFTILGQEQKELPAEEYLIKSVEKLPEANMYRFTATIKYGDTNAELPMDIPVLWAGDTPVISLTDMWLPGLGTFSARVLIYRDSYAGTWQHGEVGGHMFGTIVRAESAAGDDPRAGAEATSSTPKRGVPAKEAEVSSGGGKQ